jgi:hypothetical protein
MFSLLAIGFYVVMLGVKIHSDSKRKPDDPRNNDDWYVPPC